MVGRRVLVAASGVFYARHRSRLLRWLASLGEPAGRALAALSNSRAFCVLGLNLTLWVGRPQLPSAGRESSGVP